MKAKTRQAADEWLSELSRLASLNRRDDAGYTVEELMGKTGFSDRRVRSLLKMARTRGFLRVGKKQSLSLDGRACQTPVYRVELK